MNRRSGLATVLCLGLFMVASCQAATASPVTPSPGATAGQSAEPSLHIPSTYPLGSPSPEVPPPVPLGN